MGGGREGGCEWRFSGEVVKEIMFDVMGWKR